MGWERGEGEGGADDGWRMREVLFGQAWDVGSGRCFVDYGAG